MAVQEVGVQPVDDCRLVDRYEVIGVVDEHDTRIGQLPPVAGGGLRPVMQGLVSADHGESRNSGRCELLQIASHRSCRDKRKMKADGSHDVLLDDGPPGILA